MEATEYPRVKKFVAIKRALPANAGLDFVEMCADQGMTPEQAQHAWMQKLRSEIKTSETALSSMERQLNIGEGEAQLLHSCVRPVESYSGFGAEDGAIAAFEDAVAEKIEGGMSRQKAMSKTVLEDRERHAAYIEAYNAARREQHCFSNKTGRRILRTAAT